MAQSKLFLIDAHALCYRSYFAIKALSTTYGQSTNAVFGFVNTLRKILREYHPDYMAVCFDVGKKTRRQEKFAEYKIHRPAMPEDLVSQIPLIKDVVAAYQVPMFELEGFEADDVIATIAQKVPKKDLEVVIVSDDKDMVQLVSDRIKVFNARKDVMIDHAQAKELFGVEPQRIPDYLGLTGDQTDNIPGVNGIGETTARDLIKEYGTIENILKNLDRIKSEKIREKLTAQREQVLFSKELATLDTHVPIDVSLDMLKVNSPDTKRLFEVFKKLEFRKFTEELSQEFSSHQTVTVTHLNKTGDLENLSLKIHQNGEFAFYIRNPQENSELVSNDVFVALGKMEVYRIPPDKINFLKSIFEEKDIIKVCHDVKGSSKILASMNLHLHGKVFDVMLAGYLLSPSLGVYDIPSLAWTYLEVSMSSSDSPATDADIVFELYRLMQRELKEKQLLKLFEEIEIPLAFVLYQMEREGVKIDKDLLNELSQECEKKIHDLIKKLYDLAGMEFNLNSPKQLAHVLFEKLKLPVMKKTKTGFSTDEGVLVRLAEKHPFPRLILEYRQLSKLKSTYIDTLPHLTNPATGNIHASFNQTGTETGRLSSNNPNLQNIPIRTELGRQIRKAFIARSRNRLIISADYSQIELRILAHLSDDKNLIKAFQEDQDIHTYSASLIFDVKENDVTFEMRSTAKRVNFGIIYGMSAFGLAKDLGISQEEAQEFIDRYFLRYPGVKKFMEEEIRKAEQEGFVVTLLNRRRYLPEIRSANMAVRQLAQRQAINTPVQGSAADLIKLAMINIQEELSKKSLKSKMIISVHDELVFDAPEAEKEEMTQLIRHQMENPLRLKVPIKVTIKTGKNWLDLKEV